MKKLFAVLFFAAISLFPVSASAQSTTTTPPVPTVSQVITTITIPCSTYAGMYGIPAGYTMGDANFDIYVDWAYRYTGGCQRPTSRLVGNKAVVFTNVQYLNLGAMSGGGTDRITYNIAIGIGQVNDDGSEFYSNVRVGGWAFGEANGNVSFNPAQGAGNMYFYFPLPTQTGDQAFRQVNCPFFTTDQNIWSGFMNGADYKDGGRTVMSISIGNCNAAPSNIVVPPTPTTPQPRG